MKPLITVAIVAAIILFGGFFSLNLINNEAQSLLNELNKLEKDIQSENWDNASRKYEKFHMNWSESSDTWSMLIDHFEIDNINILLGELSSFIDSKSKKDALSKLSALKVLILHIPDKEKFTLKNIF